MIWVALGITALVYTGLLYAIRTLFELNQKMHRDMLKVERPEAHAITAPPRPPLTMEEAAAEKARSLEHVRLYQR